MSISTSTSGVDPNGDLFVYSARSVSGVNKGYSVVNGTYQQVQAGEQIDLAGIWQFANGSGALQATGDMEYRIVTITAGPTSNPVNSLLPLSTSVVGIDPSGNPVVYTPPNVVPVPIGSSVTFSAWVPVVEGGTLPNAGLVIVDVPAGSPPLQAMNLALVRPVTVTPL